jgi:hypothetical protein
MGLIDGMIGDEVRDKAVRRGRDGSREGRRRRSPKPMT